MSQDFANPLIAAGATVIAGTITLVATQFIIKFVDPCFQLKKLIGQIATDIDLLGKVCERDLERLKAAAECFRRRASELRGSLGTQFSFTTIFQTSLVCRLKKK